MSTPSSKPPNPLPTPDEDEEEEEKEEEEDPKQGKKPSWWQRLLRGMEDLYEFSVLALRLLEVFSVGCLMLGVLYSVWRWGEAMLGGGGGKLDEVVTVLTEHWQGTLIALLVILAPTVRDLTDRLVEFGGAKLTPREKNKYGTSFSRKPVELKPTEKT